MFNNFYPVNTQAFFANQIQQQIGFVNSSVQPQNIMPLHFLPYNQRQNLYLSQPMMPMQQIPVKCQQMVLQCQTTNANNSTVIYQKPFNSHSQLLKPAGMQESISCNSENPQISLKKEIDIDSVHVFESLAIKGDSQQISIEILPQNIEKQMSFENCKSDQTEIQQKFTQKELQEHEKSQQQDLRAESGNEWCSNKGEARKFQVRNETGKLLQISNIVKNFLNAFNFFLKDERKRQCIIRDLQLSEQHIRRIANIVVQQLKTRKCNNLIIKDFMTQKDISPIFIYFLQKHAADWIDQSKVRDKEAYQQILSDYIEMKNEPNLKDRLFTGKRCNRYQQRNKL